MPSALFYGMTSKDGTICYGFILVIYMDMWNFMNTKVIRIKSSTGKIISQRKLIDHDVFVCAKRSKHGIRILINL